MMKKLITIILLITGLASFAQTPVYKTTTSALNGVNSILRSGTDSYSIKDTLANYQKLTDGIVTGLVPTASGNNLSITAGTYRLNNVVRTASARTFSAIPLSASGLQRILVIFGNTSGALDTLSGAQSSNPVTPILPANTIRLAFTPVTSTTVNPPSQDLSGYAKLIGGNSFTGNQSISGGTLNVPTIFNGSTSTNQLILQNSSTSSVPTKIISQGIIIGNGGLFTGNIALQIKGQYSPASGNMVDFLSGSSYSGSGTISNQMNGFNSQPLIASSNTASFTNSLGYSGFFSQPILSSGATGTLSNYAGYLQNYTNSSAMPITNAYSYRLLPLTNSGGATITGFAGVALSPITIATNNTYWLSGTNAIPTGNWNLYSLTAYNNYLGSGNTLVNTTTDNGVDKLQVNGTASVSGLTLSTSPTTVTGTQYVAVRDSTSGIIKQIKTSSISAGGVSSITGTANQVIASSSTGAVTLSLPQSIATTSTPTFGGETLTGGLTGTTANFSSGLNITGNGGFVNAANKFGLDVNGTTSRFYASGSSTSIRGNYQFNIIASDGGLQITPLTIDGSGNTTLSGKLIM
jgi:hypothetical protein